MEFLSGDWFLALLRIIVIDLVLAGDNAIVIALAARNLPPHLQRKAILWGTAGAIIIRILMTLVVTWLLMLHGLKLVGGLGLIYIAVKLLQPHTVETEGDGLPTKSEITFWQALQTIVIADALMGLDNVLAIAGAANSDFTLVVIGLLISIPIVVFGSTLVLKLMHRLPWIIYLGAAVLAYTAVKMIVSDHFVIPYVAGISKPILYALEAVAVVVVVFFGRMLYQEKKA